MSKVVKVISLLLLLFQLSNHAICQVKNDLIINAWLEVGGLRFAPTKKEASAGINVSLKFQRNRLLANLQYHNYVDRELAHGSFELFTTNNYYRAGNMMVGITNKKCRFGHFSISTGLGVFWGEFNNFFEEKFITAGWPIEAAAGFNIFPVVGINLKVFGNINSKHSLIGFGMDLQLGKLRDFRLNKPIVIEPHLY